MSPYRLVIRSLPIFLYCLNSWTSTGAFECGFLIPAAENVLRSSANARRGLSCIGHANSQMPHCEQRKAPVAARGGVAALCASVRIMRCGSIAWPCRKREQVSVQSLHWQHAATLRRTIDSIGICRCMMSGWFFGRKMKPLDVLLTTPSMLDRRPIMGPPSMTASSSAGIAGIASSSRSATGVPMGAMTTWGLMTSPVSVTGLEVTGSATAARAIWTIVRTLLTTAPAFSGMPPSGTILPLISVRRICSSPAG